MWQQAFDCSCKVFSSSQRRNLTWLVQCKQLHSSNKAEPPLVKNCLCKQFLPIFVKGNKSPFWKRIPGKRFAHCTLYRLLWPSLKLHEVKTKRWLSLFVVSARPGSVIFHQRNTKFQNKVWLENGLSACHRYGHLENLHGRHRGREMKWLTGRKPHRLRREHGWQKKAHSEWVSEGEF